MKRFILFLSVFFFTFLSANIKAQTVDSLIISQMIECPGDLATLDVFLGQSIPPTTYNIVLQIMSPGGGFQLETEVSSTTISFHQFTNLPSAAEA